MCRHTISILAALFILALAGLLPCPARAQIDFTQPAVQDPSSKPIGKVVTAMGSVTIEHASAVIVQANVSGQASRDEGWRCRLFGRCGPDRSRWPGWDQLYRWHLIQSIEQRRMILNEFVYDPNGKSNSSLLSLTKGTFTFVAGNIADTGNMKIDTPVATMGVRGTTLRIQISDDGTAKFVVLIEEGKSKLTN